MQELINQIVEKTGIPADKANQVLGVVANFVKQKYPMIGGQIDSVLGTSGGASQQGGGAQGGDNQDSGLLGGLGSKFGI